MKYRVESAATGYASVYEADSAAEAIGLDYEDLRRQVGEILVTFPTRAAHAAGVIVTELAATCGRCGARHEVPAPVFQGVCDTCGGQSLSTPAAAPRTPGENDLARWSAAQHHDPSTGRRWRTHRLAEREYTSEAAVHLFGYDPAP